LATKTLEQFDFDASPGLNAALLQELASCRFVDERAPVLIVGPCGTGKSHLAQALGHCAVRCGHDVVFTTQTQLLGSLHAARATGAYERRFQTLVRVPLLVIDDFGLKPLRPPQDEDFHDLVAERYERGSTLVTSNLDFPEWGEAFSNRLLAAATLDRLRDGAYRVILDGESHRRPRPILGATSPRKNRTRASAAPAHGHAPGGTSRDTSVPEQPHRLPTPARPANNSPSGTRTCTFHWRHYADHRWLH
jgi:DNA replication protein DnaC